MKFDFIIGNPPYQEEIENNGRQSPIYNLFIDATYPIAEHVELITPARFLFDAGQTPKSWNQQMLQDEHFKVLYYQADSSLVFPNAEIKGGVAISIHSNSKKYGAIGIFTEYEELNSILHKVLSKLEMSVTEICVGAVPYKYTNEFKSEHPEWLKLAGDSFDLRTNALDRLYNKIYFDDKPSDCYTRVYGLFNKKRVGLWVNPAYISGPQNYGKYKLLVSKANGAGRFGETLSQMIIAAPNEGHTQSFISLGSFDTIDEALALEKYIKTKFCRCLLSILKTTQDTTPYKWKYVPLQDFTSNSDIDWSQSIADIDVQLYKKYGLNDKEIEFIESHVKEME